METYGRAQVSRHLGIPARKLESWAARGILKPVDKAPGTGKTYEFTFPEVIRAAILLYAQETLGPSYVRPGDLARALRAEPSDAEWNAERDRIESLLRTKEMEWSRKGKKTGSALWVAWAEMPEDLILHVQRKFIDRGDGVGVPTGDLEVTPMKRRYEKFDSPVVIRIDTGGITRGVVWRLAHSAAR